MGELLRNLAIVLAFAWVALELLGTRLAIDMAKAGADDPLIRIRAIAEPLTTDHMIGHVESSWVLRSERDSERS